MNKQEAIKRLRKRLVALLAGLALSYVISFGVAIFLVVDAELMADETGKPIVIGIAIVAVGLAFLHVRAQFRRYDYLVRMAEGMEDE
ncbi:MAG: hypothetical protein GKS02_12055 [Alphaproteobacteria bacterium]|nr:hypothetical protein [Alphaproteobacteria bacterium]